MVISLYDVQVYGYWGNWEISSEMCLCLASFILFCNRVHDTSVESSVETFILH